MGEEMLEYRINYLIIRRNGKKEEAFFTYYPTSSPKSQYFNEEIAIIWGRFNSNRKIHEEIFLYSSVSCSLPGVNL